jgi:Tol biopolymer transport system component
MQIVFAAGQGDKTGIYSANLDGSAMKRLTNDGVTAAFPALSPDGKRLAFASDQDGDSELYIMDMLSGAVTQITKGDGSAEDPDWSPDGKRLAFVSARNGNLQVFLINADGRGERLLTRNKVANVAPAWSPDGRWIAFSSEQSGNPDMHIVRPDGSGLKQLTRSKRYDGDTASWTPDGRSLIFPSDRIGNFELYMLELRTSTLRRLTATENPEFSGILSPDGRFLLMKTFSPDKTAHIIVKDLRTNTPYTVTEATFDASKPAWVPVPAPHAPVFDSALLTASAVNDSPCVFAKDKTYGTTADNPIPIGNGPNFGGPFDGFYIFTWLRGPNGESYETRDVGSLTNNAGKVISLYEFKAPNRRSFSLYVNGSDYSIPQIPVGYRCDLQVP